MNALSSASRFPAPIRLTLAVALALGTAGAQAQSLVELYDAAKGYDTTLQSARAQYDANLAKAEQARAGLRPQAGLAAGANWVNSRNDVTDTRAHQQRPERHAVGQPAPVPPGQPPQR